jgi:hypothetical protein
MRAINHYRLDGEDPSIAATGDTVIDLGVAKQVSHTVELNFSVAPRRPPENRPYVATSKPANEAEPGQEYL